MDLPSIKRNIALERDRLKKDKRRKVSPLATSRWCINTALCIVALLNGDLTGAVEWLASPVRRGRPIDDSIDHETARVELKKLRSDEVLTVLALQYNHIPKTVHDLFTGLIFCDHGLKNNRWIP